MEAISRHLEQHQSGTLQTSQRHWTSLESALANIILRSRSASSLPALTPVEFEIAVESWAQVIGPAIPESKLEAAYIRAMTDKESGFALGASELIKGYRDHCESERYAPQTPMDRNLLPGEVCQRCFGTGMEIFCDADGYKQSRRCEH